MKAGSTKEDGYVNLFLLSFLISRFCFCLRESIVCDFRMWPHPATTQCCRWQGSMWKEDCSVKDRLVEGCYYLASGGKWSNGTVGSNANPSCLGVRRSSSAIGSRFETCLSIEVDVLRLQTGRNLDIVRWI